jgi:ligand-binding SRPBCC domain-containing protein
LAFHQFTQIQKLPISIEQAWGFFSDPKNLVKITPSYLKFEILSELPSKIYAGELIEYRVRPLLGIPLTWVTKISHVEEPMLFVDMQIIGPYKIWHHEHHFKEIDGGIEMKDIVSYLLPFGFIGELFNPIIVRPRLNDIFNFRRTYLERSFGIYE